MLHNFFSVLFGVIGVFVLTKIFMYLFPVELNVQEIYIYAVLFVFWYEVYPINNQGASIEWWISPAVIGLGLGIWLSWTYPDTNIIHIPLLLLASLATSIIIATIKKRLIKPTS